MALKPSAVHCLGMVFDDDQQRRRYFLDRLRKKLNDPQFRTTEGFPEGSTENILALSDPPYYTACPNPFLADFIHHHGSAYQTETDRYHREPFASDVSAGKGDRNYYIHSYPTKVPPSAVAGYVEHYTSPQSLIMDCFAGSGMTAVGAALVHGGQNATLLVDLCSYAAFVSYFHTVFRPRPEDFIFLQNLVKELREQYAPWYKTAHSGWIAAANAPENWKTGCPSANTGNIPGEAKIGEIRYVVWSVVVSCSQCGHMDSLWNFCVDLCRNISNRVFHCPVCNTVCVYERKLVKKHQASQLETVYETVHDPQLGYACRRTKRIPVLISYDVGGRRFEKLPAPGDLDFAVRAAEQLVPYWCPTNRMPPGDESRRNDEAGLTHVHHFFPARTLHVLAHATSALRQYHPALLGVLTAILARCSWQNRYMPQHRGNRSREVVGPLSGTLYVPYFSLEINPVEYLAVKGLRALRALENMPRSPTLVSTQSASAPAKAFAGSNCVDYIFVDPPFGANLQYSELGFIAESWMRVFTASREEAVVNQSRRVSIADYTERMRACLKNAYELLKPGRWITVAFHNSQNAIWTAIQTALNEAGFVIADVRTLDKQKGTTKQLTLANTVRQDLVITAYKPNNRFENRFKLTAGTKAGVWEFVYTHLKRLPVFVARDGQAEIIAERQNYLLFDRMVALHVQRGVTVPFSAADFYHGLNQRYVERDDMYFLPEQVAEYDSRRLTVKEILSLQFLVTDERSAIQWLKQQLTRKPQTFQTLHPRFLKKIGGWLKHEKPLELSALLEQNFLRFDGQSEVPSQIHSYLSTNYKHLRNKTKEDPLLRAKATDFWYVPDPNKAGDLEKIRERTLLREFRSYLSSRSKQLKVFRLEAIRAGFRKAWQERDYATIITVAQKIPEHALQRDSRLLMWYDQAVTRTED